MWKNEEIFQEKCAVIGLDYLKKCDKLMMKRI